MTQFCPDPPPSVKFHPFFFSSETFPNDLLGGTFDFCTSQDQVTSTEAKPVLAPKCDWPLLWPCELGLSKNQMYIPKDPYIQILTFFGIF